MVRGISSGANSDMSLHLYIDRGYSHIARLFKAGDFGELKIAKYV